MAEPQLRNVAITELDTVPALVHTAGDSSERLLATLVENLQRLDLDPVEEAGGYRQLVDVRAGRRGPASGPKLSHDPTGPTPNSGNRRSEPAAGERRGPDPPNGRH